MLDIEGHGGSSVLGVGASIGEYDGDGLADMANLGIGERMIGDRRLQQWMRRHRRHRSLCDVGEVRHRIDRGHARHREGVARVDGANPAMGKACPHEGGMQHAGQFDIVNIVALACQQARIFHAGDGGSKKTSTHDWFARADAVSSAACTMP